MSDESKNEKEIIIDEDWKSRVEAEKEELRKKEGGASDSAEAGSAAAGEKAVPLPPPTLSFLTSSLYLQGMIALGLLPNPATNEAEANFDQARHTIDMLAMLQEKTQGNRSPEESDELEHTLHELRMAFVTLQENPPPSSASPGEDE